MTTIGESLGFRDVCFGSLQNAAWEYVCNLPCVNTIFPDALSILPQEPAIYFVTKDDDVIYVGKSVNLKNRWMHHKLRSWVGEIKIHYQVYRDRDLISLDEVAFIGIFRPEFNVFVGNVKL